MNKINKLGLVPFDASDYLDSEVDCRLMIVDCSHVYLDSSWFITMDDG